MCLQGSSLHSMMLPKAQPAPWFTKTSLRLSLDPLNPAPYLKQPVQGKLLFQRAKLPKVWHWLGTLSSMFW